MKPKKKVKVKKFVDTSGEYFTPIDKSKIVNPDNLEKLEEEGIEASTPKQDQENADDSTL